MTHINPKEAQGNLLKEVAMREQANRNPRMIALIANAVQYLDSPPKQGEILTLPPEKYAAACPEAPPIAIYVNSDENIQCVPLDPLVISYYKISMDRETIELLSSRYAFGKDSEVCRQLRLVEEFTGMPQEITNTQLIALQSLLGNISTWWPITAYSSSELKEIFSPLDLGVLYHDCRPVGVAHLDFSYGANDEAKIVFMAVDPQLHGMRLGGALLVQTLAYAYEKGVRCVYLDTVPHRDITYSKEEHPQPLPVSAFYEKFGFQLMKSEIIDPSAPPPGVEINQLNAPLGYHLDEAKLRHSLALAFPSHQ